MVEFDEFASSAGARASAATLRNIKGKVVVTKQNDGTINTNAGSFVIPEPLALPVCKRERIFGTENEFGTIGLDERTLPRLGFISNGGRVYRDCGGHLEYASPETRSPLEAVIWNRAGELICGPMARKLYKNNVATNNDGKFVSFGAHENYFFNKSKLGDLHSDRRFEVLANQLAPFLATRQIFAGAGWLKPDGTYEISQKSAFLEYLISGHTTEGRGLLNTRDEAHASVNGWMRLHLICGDANMSEVAEFMKLGTTGLVLDLIEDGKSPTFRFNQSQMVSDIQEISKVKRKWSLQIDCTPFSAVSVQRAYLDVAKREYFGRDKVTDQVIGLWEDTLDKLDKNPARLVGRVDWVTKKALIDSYRRANKLKKGDPVLQNIDLQYHDINPETSLFYALQRQGKVERLVTDEMIQHAAKNPPSTTRAWFRGNMVRIGDEINRVNPKFYYGADWTFFNSHRVIRQCSECESPTCSRNEIEKKNYGLPSPFNSYDSELKSAVAEIGGRI